MQIEKIEKVISYVSATRERLHKLLVMYYTCTLFAYYLETSQEHDLFPCDITYQYEIGYKSTKYSKFIEKRELLNMIQMKIW